MQNLKTALTGKKVGESRDMVKLLRIQATDTHVVEFDNVDTRFNDCNNWQVMAEGNPGKRNQLATAPCRSAYNMTSGRYGLVFTLAWLSCMSLMLFRTPGEGAAPQALSLQPVSPKG